VSRTDGPSPAPVHATVGSALTPLRLAFVFATAVLLGLVEVGALDYAYAEIGVPHRYFISLLVLSLVGSTIDLPLFTMPALESEASTGPTVVAVNIGGAMVPTLLSAWVIAHQQSATPVLLSIAAVAAATYFIATPVKGVGIAMPMLIPPLVAAGAALLVAPGAPAAAAYAGGTLGALVGADLLNLPRIRSLGAPVVSIGGAGTFDGVFLTGLLALLLALA